MQTKAVLNLRLIKIPVAETWFFLFMIAHLLAWSAVPAYVRDNLPMDSIEGAIWGQQLEFGYDKNPFLNGWLTAAANALGGKSGWAIYLFSQISVVICLWSVWMLGKRIISPMYALTAVLLLEAIQYFNLHAIDFNDNTLELGLWAAGTYCFYQAVRRQNYFTWICTATFLALGLMAKYYTLTLIAAFFFFLLRKENRHLFLTIPPYVGLAVFAAIITPHVIWLFNHDFITVDYVFARANAEPSWTNHLFFPAQFLWQQFEVFIPALIIFGFLFLGEKPRIATPPPPVSSFDKTFLQYAALGPILITAFISLVWGNKLRAGWGMPLQSFWTLLLVVYLPPRLSRTKIIALILGIIFFMAALLSAYSFSIIDSSDTSSANFPGKDLARAINHRWEDKYHTRLEYVAGNRWIGGNIAYYTQYMYSHRPSVYMEWNKKRSPWIKTSDLKRKGAVFVWNISRHETLPEAVRAQYPTLTKPMVMTFNWKRNTHDLPPIKIGVAFLPPA